jgi:hypothetical protein
MMVVGGAASRERSRAKVCPTKVPNHGVPNHGVGKYLCTQRFRTASFVGTVTLILRRSGGTQTPVRYGTRWENSAHLKSSN